MGDIALLVSAFDRRACRPLPEQTQARRQLLERAIESYIDSTGASMICFMHTVHSKGHRERAVNELADLVEKILGFAAEPIELVET